MAGSRQDLSFKDSRYDSALECYPWEKEQYQKSELDDGDLVSGGFRCVERMCDRLFQVLVQHDTSSMFLGSKTQDTICSRDVYDGRDVAVCYRVAVRLPQRQRLQAVTRA